VFKKTYNEPSLKKPGDFTVAEGHGHPLVMLSRSKKSMLDEGER